MIIYNSMHAVVWIVAWFLLKEHIPREQKEALATKKSNGDKSRMGGKERLLNVQVLQPNSAANTT